MNAHPTPPTTARLIDDIHRTPMRLALVVTGGGSRAVSSLLSRAGASRTVLEAVIPYSSGALIDYLGEEPERACSRSTAGAMARMAYCRAGRLHAGRGPVTGIACTASLASDRPKRGAHRCHVAAHTLGQVCSWTLELVKGARSRDEEEEIVAGLILYAAAVACGLPRPELPPLRPDEEVLCSATETVSRLNDVLAGERPLAIIGRDGHVHDDARKYAAVLPGSFNPLHEGHRRLYELARRRVGRAVFELSVVNVDKPSLEWETVIARAWQFVGWADLAVTAAPRFFEKAALFHGPCFVIGFDTAQRLVAPRYYAGEAEMIRKLSSMRDRGCRFVVAGRLVDKAFRTLEDLELPESVQDMFEDLPENEFRLDISSTELRASHS